MMDRDDRSPSPPSVGLRRRDSVLNQASFIDPNYISKTFASLATHDEEEDAEAGRPASQAETVENGLHQENGLHHEFFTGPFTIENSVPGIELDFNMWARVLVLYTGGTIGMKEIDGGLAPVPNNLHRVLQNSSHFHDQDLADQLKIPANLPNHPLVLRNSSGKQHVVYYILEYDPLLDSCNMTMTDWVRLALDVKKHYTFYEGFVILHGTDTMAYTASALSFMMEDLGKPVIITGSQIPIYETRSDGRDNFLGALVMAGNYVIPEVTILFNNKLLRGNRTIKKDAGAFNAFETPNLPALADLAIDIKVNWDSVYQPTKLSQMSVHTSLCPNVGILRFFPSMTAAMVGQFLQPPLEAVVLQTYGAGNGPDSRTDLLQLFQEASDRGVLIVNITQCSRGHVKMAYSTGKALEKAGIIPGADMTPEAALTKVAYLLGRTDFTLKEKRMYLGINLRGELTSLQEEQQIIRDIPLLTRLKQVLKITSNEEMDQLRTTVYPAMMCSAAGKGSIEAMKQLKEAGAPLTQPDYDRRTPLHVAAAEGHYEALVFLLTNGALVHARDRCGQTPLDDAINNSRHDIIEILVKTGARLTTLSLKLGSELCLAASQNDVSRLESYRLAGANLDQGDYDKRRALHLASSHNQTESVEYLLKHGCSSTLPDAFGQSPLDCTNSPEIVNLIKRKLND